MYIPPYNTWFAPRVNVLLHAILQPARGAECVPRYIQHTTTRITLYTRFYSGFNSTTIIHSLFLYSSSPSKTTSRQKSPE